MGYHSARSVYLRVMHDRMCEIPKWHLLAYNSSGEMFELVQNHIFKCILQLVYSQRGGRRFLVPN